MIEEAKALAIWHKEIGNKEYAYDFSGRKIKQSDYLKNNQVGWVVSYLRPLNQGGKDNDGNVIIMHHRTAEEKGQKFPDFSIEDRQYHIEYDSKGDYYYVEKVIDTDDDDEESLI
ncbi:MAG: hypothetical protein AB7V00_05555 [Bacilli bacterium]